jgi:hypothetical protein
MLPNRDNGDVCRIDYMIGSAVFACCGRIRELSPGATIFESGLTDNRGDVTCKKCLHPANYKDG